MPFEVGERVWVGRNERAVDPVRMVRGTVAEVDAALGYVRVRTACGTLSRPCEAVLPYSAVDALAALERCQDCLDYGEDRCDDHRPDLIRIRLDLSASTSTTFHIDLATDLFDEPDLDSPTRRKLVARERLHRRKRMRIAKASRRRNWRA